MTDYVLLFIDYPLTKDSILEETKNDPELAKYYDYIKGGNLRIDPSVGHIFDRLYSGMHDVIPNYIVGFFAFTQIYDKNDVSKEIALNVRLWLYSYIKKMLKKSRVWYAAVDIEKIPSNSSGLKIVNVDINKIMSEYDRIDKPIDYRNTYFQIIDPGLNNGVEQ